MNKATLNGVKYAGKIEFIIWLKNSRVMKKWEEA